MELLDIANHLLNFVAPALFVALLLALAGRVVRGRGALVGGFWRGLWRSVWVNALLGSRVAGCYLQHSRVHPLAKGHV